MDLCYSMLIWNRQMEISKKHSCIQKTLGTTHAQFVNKCIANDTSMTQKALVSQCTNKKHSNFKKTLTAVPSLLIITFIPNHTLNSSGISQSTMYNYTVLILSAMSMYLMSGTNINTQFTYFGAWLNYRLSLFR